MRTVIIIPARYKSSRFPGKPLAMIRGKSLLQRTWERCVAALPPEQVHVATDDERIADHCHAQGMQVVITGSDCLTGTDRVYEASLQIEADLYVNVQGDEPMIAPGDIQAVIEASKRQPGTVINAMCPIMDEADFRSPHVPKVVAAPDGRLLYMSRAGIPVGKTQRFEWAWRQVCIYGFPPQALARFAAATAKTPLEEVEDIEILRFLEQGIPVQMVAVSGASVAVDLPEDVAKVEAALDLAALT